MVLLSGALSGAMCGVYYWFTNPGWGMMRVSIYLGTSVVGGVIAAAACIALSRAIAAPEPWLSSLTGVFVTVRRSVPDSHAIRWLCRQ